ncbi:MAG: DUF2945 domain-containing protein [Gemmataceae bacterium]
MAKKTSNLKVGDSVEWNTSQGKTKGKITKKVTKLAKAGGHRAKASKAKPQFEVTSAKSGKKAIHQPTGLKKTK